jgi:hypothetical protein
MKMLLSSAELTACLAEMTAASVCVVAQRSRLFAFGSNTARKRRECSRMILEKFQGGGEFAAAISQALAENYPLMVGSIISRQAPLAKNPCPIPAGVVLAFSTGCISTPLHVGIFVSAVGLQSMAPLRKRVIDNMERLSH